MWQALGLMRLAMTLLLFAVAQTCAHAQQATPEQQPASAQQTDTAQGSPIATPASMPQTSADPASGLQPAPVVPTTQTSPAPTGTVERGPEGTFTLRQNAYEVRLNASVIDGSGHSVQTLDKDAFHVTEDGVAQTINSFRHEDLPVSLGILIDSSGSMYSKQSAVAEASLDLVKLSNPQDEAFLVDFSGEPFIDQEFTSDIENLKQGLSYITPKGETAMYDALVLSAEHLATYAKHPKQVLLIITDGQDDASSASLEEAVRRIQDFDGPVVYCIGLLFGDDVSKSEAKTAKRVLEAIAEQTGGAAYFPKSVKEVDAITREVANDIRTQYTITYHSTKAPELGGYRVVRVEAKAKGYGKLSVRTRSGYYPRAAGAAAKTLANSPAASTK